MAALQLSSLLPFAFLIVCCTSASGHGALPRSLLAQNELAELNRHALGLDSVPAFGSVHSLHISKATSPVGNSSSSSGSHKISSSSSCEETYGVFPCTDNIIGNIFLLAAYGYLLFVAAKLLSEGSEMLLAVLDPGLIGGLLLPILGALPDSLLILVSGLGGTQAEAQEEVLVGIGLLAGSIVMLLSLLWGSCLIIGRCDLVEVNGKYTAKDKTLTRGFSLTGTGVENDDLTRLSAGIMILSVIPYIVAQIPRIFSFSDDGNVAVLVACILAFAGLAAYCFYQVFTPWIQERRKQRAETKYNKLLAFQQIIRHGGDDKQLMDNTGKLNHDYAKELFKAVDRNKDNSISSQELQILLAVSFSSDQTKSDMVEHFMNEFDKDKNRSISEDEFLAGMEKLCLEFRLKPGHSLEKHITEAENERNEFNQEAEDDDDEETKPPPSKRQIIKKAVMLLVIGTVIVAVFADPLVDAVSDFSDASSIPSFFLSFVLLPIASTSSEAVSSILFAGRKKKVHMSLTYSQVYGAVTMNNTLGLGIFLAVVYGRSLTWDFTSEVLVICVITVVMGGLASFRKIFPLWVAFFSLLLYPLALGLVAILDYVVGWE